MQRVWKQRRQGVSANDSTTDHSHLSIQVRTKVAFSDKRCAKETIGWKETRVPLSYPGKPEHPEGEQKPNHQRNRKIISSWRF